MNAIQFIKEHGVEKAREVVEGAPVGVTHYGANNYWNWDGKILKRRADNGFFINSIHGISDEWVSKTASLSDLKRLVESVDLVKSYGGIINAKMDIRYLDIDWDYDTLRRKRLKQAIADYEAIHHE